MLVKVTTTFKIGTFYLIASTALLSPKLRYRPIEKFESARDGIVL